MAGPDGIRTRLGRQAAEVLDQDTDWCELVSLLDVKRYRGDDSHSQGERSAPFEPMLLAYLWASVEDESLTGIPNRLEATPDLAEAVGFAPDGVPSDSTFKPSRLETRFADIESTVSTAADEIRELAADRGAPIGFELDTAQDATEESPPSERTIQRQLRRKGKEVLEELQSVLFPALSLPQPDDAIYDDDELLALKAIAAIDQLAANGADSSLAIRRIPTHL